MFFNVFWSVLECFFGHQTGLKCFFCFFFRSVFFGHQTGLRFEGFFWLFFGVFVFFVVFNGGHFNYVTMFVW